MTVEFIDEVPASVTTGKRGRPETFSADLQAAAKENPGKWLRLQTGVKGRSRVSALRARYNESAPGQFLFRGAVTSKTTDEAGKVTEILDVYVSAVAVETTTDEAPAPTKTRSRAKAKA